MEADDLVKRLRAAALHWDNKPWHDVLREAADMIGQQARRIGAAEAEDEEVPNPEDYCGITDVMRGVKPKVLP